MAGERGLDGDFSRFQVADFADQNDVGILTQERAQGCGEVQADLLLHLHLVDAGELEFDGIFGRHDVGVGLVEREMDRVQRVGLALTRLGPSPAPCRRA